MSTTITIQNTNYVIELLSGNEIAISSAQSAIAAKNLAETARDEAVSAKDIAVTKASEASSDADQTALDRIATGADRVVVETKASEVASNTSIVSDKTDIVVTKANETEINAGIALDAKNEAESLVGNILAYVGETDISVTFGVGGNIQYSETTVGGYDAVELTFL